AAMLVGGLDFLGPVARVDPLIAEELEHVDQPRKDEASHVAADAEIAGPRRDVETIDRRAGPAERDVAIDAVDNVAGHLVVGHVAQEGVSIGFVGVGHAATFLSRTTNPGTCRTPLRTS